mgnify:CR=1 FL=1
MLKFFRDQKDSWLVKGILILTALSFMSLFGVSGYINTANSNKPVIKVDDLEISQSEFNYLLQKELAKLKDTDTAKKKLKPARRKFRQSWQR